MTNISPKSEALILLGKIQYIKEYDSGKIHLLDELLNDFDAIKEKLLELEDKDPEITEIIRLFTEHEREEEPVSEAGRVFSASAGLIRK